MKQGLISQDFASFFSLFQLLDIEQIVSFHPTTSLMERFMQHKLHNQGCFLLYTFIRCLSNCANTVVGNLLFLKISC